MQALKMPPAAASTDLAPAAARERQLDGVTQSLLVHAAGAPVKLGVAEGVLLHVLDQRPSAALLEAQRPTSQAPSSRLASSGLSSPPSGPSRASPSRSRREAISSTRRGSGDPAGSAACCPPSVRIASAIAACAHLAGLPCRAAGARPPAPQVREELARCRRLRRLGVGAPDVDAGVVVAAADADPVTGRDVHRGGPVELGRPGAVADLPDREQRGQALAVARAERRADRVVGVGQGADDVALVHVGGAQLEVAAVGLQPLVVLGRDPVAEDVHRLGLAAEARGQLLRDEHVGAVGDLEDAVDRVVVGDRHEVHAAALGQRVDLLWRGRALGQAERPLDAELRDLRGGGVAVQVGPAGRHGRRRGLLYLLS